MSAGCARCNEPLPGYDDLPDYCSHHCQTAHADADLDDHIDYIHEVAKQEWAVRQLDVGDEVEIEAMVGDLRGTVTAIHDHGESGFVARIDEDGDLSIDYEGAYTSYFAYYLPYVVAGEALESHGDVLGLVINGETITENALQSNVA